MKRNVSRSTTTDTPDPNSKPKPMSFNFLLPFFESMLIIIPEHSISKKADSNTTPVLSKVDI
jgi:hypothetical protein